MARKGKNPSFDQIVEQLRSQGFEVTSNAAASKAVQISKSGVAAVIAPNGGAGRDASRDASQGEGSAAGMVVTPGVLVRGEIARLLDRGYQKFLKTSQFELPATAQQLQAIHTFTEEMNLVTGTMGLYNESLGTTSDLYEYDRLRGRETPQPPAARPWELTAGH
jgi:hypothetical protein